MPAKREHAADTEIGLLIHATNRLPWNNNQASDIFEMKDIASWKNPISGKGEHLIGRYENQLLRTQHLQTQACCTLPYLRTGSAARMSSSYARWASWHSSSMAFQQNSTIHTEIRSTLPQVYPWRICLTPWKEQHCDSWAFLNTFPEKHFNLCPSLATTLAQSQGLRRISKARACKWPREKHGIAIISPHGQDTRITGFELRYEYMQSLFSIPAISSRTFKI